MQLHERADQLSVGTHMHRHTGVDHRLHDLFGEQQKQEDDEVEKADAEEKNPFANLAVIELAYAGNYRQHCSHVWIASRLRQIVWCSC